MANNFIYTPDQLVEISATVQARTLRMLEESEGRIPPLTQRQAYDGYGRRRVEAWVKSGRLHPKKKGKVGLLYLHSELEYCRKADNFIVHINR